MKKILLILVSSLFPLLSFGQVTNDYESLAVRYLDLKPVAGGGTSHGMLESDRLDITAPAAFVGPKINFAVIGPPNYQALLWYVGNSFLLTTNLSITGSLTVSGTVNSTTNLAWVTNNIGVTNAWAATNASDGFLIVSTNMLAAALLFPTNNQTVAVDLTIPYGDLNVTDTFAFTGVKNKASTNYQTAVVIVHSTLGSATNFTIPANVHAQGSLWITNDTVCTWFYNPNPYNANPALAGMTNVIALPLW